MMIWYGKTRWAPGSLEMNVEEWIWDVELGTYCKQPTDLHWPGRPVSFTTGIGRMGTLPPLVYTDSLFGPPHASLIIGHKGEYEQGLSG